MLHDLPLVQVHQDPAALSSPSLGSTQASPTHESWAGGRCFVSFDRSTTTTITTASTQRRQSSSSDADCLPLSQTSSLSHRTMGRTSSTVRPSTNLSSQSSFHPDDLASSSQEKVDCAGGMMMRSSFEVPSVSMTMVRDDPSPHRRSDSASTSIVLETSSLKKSTTRKGYRKINQYKLGERLGNGAYSEVYMAADGDNNGFAIKVLDRHRLVKLHALTMERSEVENKILLEIAALKRLRHPNIIALHEVINDPESKELYLVLELAVGPIMTLDDAGRVVPDEKNQTRLPEAEAARITKALINATRYAHYCGVAHRDIKPQNVLLSEFNEVKLADFGVSAMIDEWMERPRSTNSCAACTGTPPSAFTPMPGDSCDPLCCCDYDDFVDGPSDFPDAPQHRLKFRAEGTVCFMAPEFLDPDKAEGEDVAITDLFAADIWSLGVTVYTMTIGQLPWQATQAKTLFEAIKAHHELPFPPDCGASSSLRDFLRCCIRVNPADRLSLKLLAHHPWITGRESFTGGSNSSFGSSFATRSTSQQQQQQDGDAFRNFSFNFSALGNGNSTNNNNNAGTGRSLGLSVSFQEPPVCISPSDVQNAVTWRRPPSVSLEASRRFDASGSIDPTSPVGCGSQHHQHQHLQAPQQPHHHVNRINYNTLHTASPSGQSWHSPPTRNVTINRSGGDFMGQPVQRLEPLDPLDITATLKEGNDEEEDFEDLSPPAISTASQVTTPSAQSNAFSSALCTPQANANIMPMPSNGDDEGCCEDDEDTDLSAVKTAFDAAVLRSSNDGQSHPPLSRHPASTPETTTQAQLHNLMSPKDPLSLSNTMMFSSRDAVPLSCVCSPTPVIPFASPPPPMELGRGAQGDDDDL